MKNISDVIILHMCTKNHNHMMYASCDMEWYRYKFLWFWAIFCPFTPLTTQKENILEKPKKMSGDIIILQKCTVNHDHVMYDSWDMKRDRQNFFVILGHFMPLYLTNNPKNQNFEKMKKAPEDIIILHKCTKNHDRMLYWSWDMVRDGCNCYFSFWTIFCPFTPPRPLTAQKITIKKKNGKIGWGYHHFTYVYQKLWSDNVLFLRYGVRWTNGRTKKVTYWGWCPT